MPDHTPSALASGRVDAVVFDLLYTLAHPGTYPGGVDRIAWLASLIHVNEAALREGDREFERAVDSGQGPGTGQPNLHGSWRTVERTLETGGAPGCDGIEPEIQWALDSAKSLGGVCDDHTLALIRQDWDLTRREALRHPDPSAIPTIRALQKAGIKVGVLSNTHTMEVRTWPDGPLAEVVDAAVFSHEIGVMKPDAAAYAAILNLLGARADRAVYVGDGGSDELVGATDAGFALVVLAEKAPQTLTPQRITVLRAQSHTTIKDLSELPGLVGVDGER